MRIAITGGGGELGRTLIPYLIEQGHSVVSIDRAPPAASPPSAHRPDFIVADTRDFGQFVASIRGCDGLIHLAAHRSPINMLDHVVYADNTVSSYNALSAAATLGIKRVCLASSINAIGGVFSRAPRYDYFPVDEQHPTYAEDAYSLSKWVLEQQADAFARRFEGMTHCQPALPLAGRAAPDRRRYGAAIWCDGEPASMGLHIAQVGQLGVLACAHRRFQRPRGFLHRGRPVLSHQNSRSILRASIIRKPRFAAIYPATRPSSTRARPSACLAGSTGMKIVGFSLLVGRFSPGWANK